MKSGVSITTHISEAEASAWDNLVESVPYSDVAQLSKWAHARAAAGYSPVYLFLREGERIIAGAQLLRYKVPMLGWIYYFSGGPLIDPSCPGPRHRDPPALQLDPGPARKPLPHALCPTPLR